MGDIYLHFPCGYIKEYKACQSLRGCRHKGKRPVRAVVFGDIPDEIKYKVLPCVLHPGLHNEIHKLQPGQSWNEYQLWRLLDD